MSKPGLSVSVRYGAEIELVGIGVLKVIEPVAGFNVGQNPCYGDHPVEHWIGLDPIHSGCIYQTDDDPDSPVWIIRPASFRGSGVDLVLVDQSWLDDLEDNSRAIIPPGIRLEFSVRIRRQAWGNQIIDWLGNGCDFEFMGNLYTLREDEHIQIDIPGHPSLTVHCLNIKGRGRVELRLEIDPSVKIVRK